jgi:hypothetical protein
MPRPLRAFGEGIFHLTAHASDIRYLFLNDEDREDFLRRLAAVCKRLEPGLLCYVLMGNHYHVIVRIPDTRISHALRLLDTEIRRGTGFAGSVAAASSRRERRHASGCAAI